MFRPDIFTNSYADFFAADFKRLDAACRLEIAIFIENIVGRQKGLGRLTDRFAPLEQSRRVAKRFAAPLIAINEPDQQRRFSDASVQFLQDPRVLEDEERLKNQILRPISRDRQLRGQHQIRARRDKALVSADDQFAIAAQIAHRGVNLSKTNLHAALKQIMRNAAASNPLFLALSISPRHAVVFTEAGQLSDFPATNSRSGIA